MSMSSFFSVCLVCLLTVLWVAHRFCPPLTGRRLPIFSGKGYHSFVIRTFLGWPSLLSIGTHSYCRASISVLSEVEIYLPPAEYTSYGCTNRKISAIHTASPAMMR